MTRATMIQGMRVANDNAPPADEACGDLRLAPAGEDRFYFAPLEFSAWPELEPAPTWAGESRV